VIRKILVLVLFFSLVAVPSTEVSAIPTGVGVMGDSGTQPYQCIGRGDETSFTWTEVLAALRGIDFGGEPCEPYNQAWSGETVALNMESQTSNVLDDFNAGRIGKVIIMLGHNDLYGNPNTPDIPSVLATYRTNLDRLLNAGIAPGNILMIDVSQENWDGPMKAYVDQFNLGLRNLSIEKGTVFTTWAYFHTEVACRSTDGGNSYNVGGQMIVNSFGNEYHNWRVADGHLGTLANGLFANALVTDFLGVPRMTDAELLTLVNGAVVPSNPPPNCSPAPTLTPLPAGSATATGTVFPTATRTPTPVISPTPTFTWTPTPLVSSTPTTAGSPTATGSSTTITIGETSVLGMSYSGIGNRLVAQQVTLSQSATIQSLSYYVATASGQLRLGIYNNSGTMPGTLVAQTAAFTPVVGWNTQPVLTQTVLPAGTYWLAFLPQNNTLAGRVALSGTGRHYSYTFGALPATFSTSVTSDSFHFSMYATLSTGAAVPSNTPSATPLPSSTATSVPSQTPSNTPLPGSTATNTLLPSSTPTNTPVPSSTPSNTPLPSNTPTNTPAASLTPSQTPTITPVPSTTSTRTPTNTSAPSNTPTRTPTSSGAVITIGETNILGIGYSGMANRLVAQQVTLSQSATIQSLSYYVATASGQLRLGIYNNSGSMPGTLVAQTAAFTPVVGWNTQPVLTQTVLPAGTYWLAFLPQNNTLAGRVALSGTGRHYSYTFGALPATFSTSVTSDSFHFSMYATLSQ